MLQLLWYPAIACAFMFHNLYHVILVHEIFFLLITVFLLIAVKCDSANITSLVSNSLFNYKSII